MSALSLPVLSMSETERVFNRLSAANQRQGHKEDDQSEERRENEAPMTRLQPTLKPKSASFSCHCGHNYLETDDKSRDNYLTTAPSSSTRAKAVATYHLDISEILFLDEIQTKKKV